METDEQERKEYNTERNIMMRKRFDIIRFALKCVLIPAAAMFLIYLMNRPYKAIDEQKYQDILKFDMLGRNYWEVHIGNLGSSHGAYDFVYDDIMARGYVCFNFANTSQSYNYDYAILKQFGQYMVDGSVLFIPVSYFSFNNETVNETEAQALSVKYYHCLSPKNIPDYDLYTDIVTTRLPILSAGEDLFRLLPSFSLSLKAFAAEDNPNGGMDEAAVAEFANRAAMRYDRHFNNKENLFLPEREEQLLSLIDYCQKHGLMPVLITTPFSSYYNTQVSGEFLDRFYGTINRISSDTDVSYYDYSHDKRFQENLTYFSDSDHLNAEGAAYFMEIIAEEVPELRAALGE